MVSTTNAPSLFPLPFFSHILELNKHLGGLEEALEDLEYLAKAEKDPKKALENITVIRSKELLKLRESIELHVVAFEENPFLQLSQTPVANPSQHADKHYEVIRNRTSKVTQIAVQTGLFIAILKKNVHQLNLQSETLAYITDSEANYKKEKKEAIKQQAAIAKEELQWYKKVKSRTEKILEAIGTKSEYLQEVVLTRTTEKDGWLILDERPEEGKKG